LKILKNKEFQSQIVRYILISILGYSYVFTSLYLMVTILKIDKLISFMIVYGILYSSLYFIQLKLVFKAEHKKQKILRFSISTAFLYISTNALYIFFSNMGIEYLTATLLTIIFVIPTRFLVSKYYVHK
jgi:putative flippase GtrA